MTRKALVLLTLLGCFASSLIAQHRAEGVVLEHGSRLPVAGAHVRIGPKVTATDLNGFFSIDGLDPGLQTITVTAIGFEEHIASLQLGPGQKQEKLTILLKEKMQGLDEVVVTATRSENRISDIPGRIEMISPEKLRLTVSQSIDEVLALLPGVTVSRSFGLFSHKSTVSMRGLGGNEQARTLVLVDGIPVNKADGGSVNWNLISMLDIERVELLKGPGSALYGGNAMGGVINVIRRKPSHKTEANLGLSYGTYNTRGIKANAGRQHNSGLFWSAGAFVRASDGYITQSWADRQANPYIVKSAFDEKMMAVRGGYKKNDRFEVNLDLSVFDDRRETGEKVNQPHGNTTDHDSYQFRAAFAGREANWNWSATLFYLNENYKRVSEWQKDDYTWYDVRSLREDLGLLTALSRNVGRHSLTAGFDIRHGAVDASDIYYTSTDQVDNKGKMRFLGFYFQDQLHFFDDKLQLIAGLRYDEALFYDAAFVIHQPSAETRFMSSYQFSGLSAQHWGAMSPRLSIQYKPHNNFRVFLSYSRGFRPSVLDDLCRSGRVRGGFKVARPNLKPESIDNLEAGVDYRPTELLHMTASIFYAAGHDFLYYVSTGDSIDMGFGNRPVMIRSNISEVNIYGFEGSVNSSPLSFLNLTAAYAFTVSKITGYAASLAVSGVDLTGKTLADVPRHTFTAGAFARLSFLDAGLTARYTGKMFVNDQNSYDDLVLSNQYPATFTLDLKLRKSFLKHFDLGFTIQNLLDQKIYESKGAVGPGRFMLVDLSCHL